jgi:hypothetical protein
MEQVQWACRRTTVRKRISMMFEGGSGGNKRVQAFGKLIVQAAVGYHEDLQTVNPAVGHEVSHSEPPPPNSDEHL